LKTKLTKLDIDWIEVKDDCRITVNKKHSDAEATESFKKALLLSEHSPIRSLRVKWLWDPIKSWVATHFSRHHIGWEKFIGTQRDDRTGVSRDDKPQSTPVPMKIEANAQSLINVSKVRLCYGGPHKEAREYTEDLKVTLHNNPLTKEIADVMVPTCIYRAGCPEFGECKFFDNFAKDISKEDLIDIQTRYDIYNEQFYKRMEDNEL
jgi:hypothetical protein